MALERLSQVTDSGISTGIVLSNASVTGVLTATNEINVGSGLTLTSSAVNVTGAISGNQLNISGVSTFVGVGTFQNDLYVGGDLSVSGIITSSSDITLKDLNYTADYPTIRPSLDLAFAQTKQLDSRITFTRSSTGTYVGTDGLIKTAAVDAPRFDHDPTTGESLGLLIEESRTNLFTYSEEFDNSAWSKTRTTVSANSIIAPDGTLTADKIIEDVGTSQDYILDENASSSVATYTYSFFAKAGERSHIRVSRSTGNQTSFIHYYTLENNGTATGGGNIVAYPNGWYRCYGQTEVTSAGTAGFAIRLENSSTNTIYNGDGSSGFYLWGAQYEQGTFATSYIPTSGSTVTRSADYASMTGTNFSSWYNQTEGTFYAEADTINPRYNTNITGYDGNNNNYTVLGTGDSPNRFQLRFDDAYPYQVLGFGPNSTTAITSTNPTTTTTSMKIAGTVKQDYIRGYANGESILVDSTFDMISPSALYIGSLNGTTEINPGHIQRIMYYPRVLNNSQLQNITL